MSAVPPLLAVKLLTRRKCNHISCPVTLALRHGILAGSFHHALMGPFAYRLAAGLPPAPALFELPVCLISQSPVYKDDVKVFCQACQFC